jgi:hypothetical protein
LTSPLALSAVRFPPAAASAPLELLLSLLMCGGATDGPSLGIASTVDFFFVMSQAFHQFQIIQRLVFFTHDEVMIVRRRKARKR